MRTELVIVGTAVILTHLVGCSRGTSTPAKDPAPVAVVKTVPVDASVYVSAFDRLWADMDLNYSYFELKKIDWPALKAKYRPQAEAAKSSGEFVEVLRNLLAEVKDEHIRIEGPAGRVVPYQVKWDGNWSIKGIQSQWSSVEMVGKFVSVGKLKDGFGMIHMENQGAATPELAQKAVEKIEALGNAPGFIVDLRRALGGNEANSMPLASAFCAKPTVYAKQKFRNGPGHGDFGPVNERSPLTAGKKPFTKPVVVLLGPAIMSSGEGLAMMFAALPNVTTVGSPTRGSSGNPQPVELKEVGLTVHYSRWVAMLPDGTPIEGRGIIPQIEAKFPATAFGSNDPVLEKALEVLRAKVK
jgi:C-terminal processing protease CtpA/Prc